MTIPETLKAWIPNEARPPGSCTLARINITYIQPVFVRISNKIYCLKIQDVECKKKIQAENGNEYSQLQTFSFSAQQRKVAMSRSSLVNRPRALMIDLSGTIHIEDKPIPGAIEAGTFC